MFTMKYTPKASGASPVPILVELEMDGGFHVNGVWLIVGNERFKCEYMPRPATRSDGDEG